MEGRSLFDTVRVLGRVLAGGAILALLTPAPPAAARPAGFREEACRAAERLRREQPGIQIELDAATGLARRVRNLALPAPEAGDRVAAAAAFLEAHRPLLLGDRSPAEMALAAVEESATGTQVIYQQEYRGLPVWGARFAVHLDARGAVRLAQGTVRPQLAVETTPRIGTAEALRLAHRSVGGRALRGEARVDLGVFPAGDGARLAYRVDLPVLPPADWRVFVDAASGAVLSQLDLLQHAEAEGLVVEESLFTTPELVTRPFTDLIGDGEILKGAFADVGSFDRIDARGRITGRRLSRAVERRFAATADDPRFDEQMLYYHVTRMHDYLRRTFGFTKRDHALPVVAHMPKIEEFSYEVQGPLNNAYYSPMMDALFFGDGTGTANGGINATSRDADVIYHEYAHASIRKIVPNLNGEIERNVFGAALNEGYADYLACAFLNDPALAEYTVGRAEGMRNLVNERRFPEDVNHPKLKAPESHWTGQIWAGACWELRGRLGAEVTDQIVFASLSYLPQDGNASLPSAAEALLEADAALYDGAHAAAIRQVMEGRGLLQRAVAFPE